MRNLYSSQEETLQILREFVDSGGDESASPFLCKRSRTWAKNINLKTSCLSALCLIFSFVFSYFLSNQALSLTLLVLIFFISGTPSLIRAIETLLKFKINIDLLMTLAAFLSAATGNAYEGALLLVLFDLSKALEDTVTHQAKSTLNKLQKLNPESAWVKDSQGKWVQKHIKDIAPGSHILVKVGEIIPLDGTILSGTSSLDLSHLTGESLPQLRSEGEAVLSGSKNLEGALTIETSAPASESTLSKIIEQITKAQKAKPKLQRTFNSFSSLYAKSIILLSFMIGGLLPLLTSIEYTGLEGSINRALSFLIAASPCALIIAIPVAYLSSINACARKGILLKGGVVLDQIAQCKAIAFDKTGTLTESSLSVTSVETFTSHKNKQALETLHLSITKSLEECLVHPIAESFLKWASSKRLPSYDFYNFKAIPGSPISATFTVNKQETYSILGSLKRTKDQIPKDQLELVERSVERLKEEGKAYALISTEKGSTLIGFENRMREGVKDMMAELHQKKMNLYLLTGDHIKNANKISKALKIKEIYADLKPEDKFQIIEKLSSKNPTIMIGDGVNDAPSLARAHVGISMGASGSYSAVDASDAIFLHDRIDHLAWLVKKGRATHRVVIQNLSLALSTILIASLFALAGYIPLWAAVIAHEGGTLLVGLNGLRLLRNRT